MTRSSPDTCSQRQLTGLARRPENILKDAGIDVGLTVTLVETGVAPQRVSEIQAVSQKIRFQERNYSGA